MNASFPFRAIASAGVLLSLLACQTPEAPVPTASPRPTAAAPSTARAAPTATATPLCGKLAPAPPITPTSPSSATVGKFEPPDGQVYFGFTFRLWGDDMSIPDGETWGDTRTFAERICDSVDVELAAKTPTILKVQSDWKSRNGILQPFGLALRDIEMIHSVLGSSVTPMLEWGAGESDLAEEETATTRDIAGGRYDDYIRQYARDVKSYGSPLFIRLICGEFNGGWWPWCSPMANPGLSAEDFVSAWRRVVDIFREEEVTNVAWIWIPVAFPPPPADWGRDPNWQAYYPGDEYVDWVGADLNDWGKPSWLDPLYQFGVDHAKPFFLAEFAIRHEGTGLTHQQQIQWLGAMFDYFESHPRIKAVIYFNYKNRPDPDPRSPDHVSLYDGRVNYVPNANDHDQRLLAGGDDMRALFATRVADPRYVSSLAIAP